MDKQDVFNYVMKTPDNTNPAILKEMLDEISGGGNPNSVEIITGTLDTVFSTPQNLLDLIALIQSNNATAIIATNENAALGLPATREIGITYPGVNNQLKFAGTQLSDLLIDCNAVEIVYAGQITPNGHVLNGGNVANVGEYASMITCTLTIIHHPLPEDNP